MKLDKRQVICVSLGIILALAVTFVEKQDTVLTKGNGLERNTYGQGETQQEILVEGLLAKKVPLSVRIGERRYTKEEAADAIHMAAEELSAQIAGGNESLEQVQSRLELVTWLDKYGISVRWQPDDTELISASGEVFNSGCPESGRETFLTATLKAGEYAEDYIPGKRSPAGQDAGGKRTCGFRELSHGKGGGTEVFGGVHLTGRI